MARIRFDNVTKRYGNVVAVDGLDLEIRDKEFIVLLGPSGCGKTTTLNMIAGLDELTEGDIYFDDQIVNFMPPHKRDAAMVFQSYALYPHMSVYDNLAFGLRLRKTPKQEIERRVQEAAELLAIGELLDRKPKQLSGGMKQRVAIARALALNPEVLLLDEPFGALDAVTRRQMNFELQEIWSRDSITTLLITHSVEEAVLLADRLIVLTQRPGRIKLIEEVPFGRPRDRELMRTTEFHQLCDKLTAALDSAEGDPDGG